MKTFCTFLSLFLFVFGGTLRSQSLITGKDSFTASLGDAANAGHRSFSIQVKLGEGSRYLLRDEHPEERILIPGWKRLPAHAQVLVTISSDDVLLGRPVIREEVTATRNVRGKMVNERRYFGEIGYHYSSRLEVHDFRGRELLSQPLSSAGRTKIFRTRYFTSRDEALNAVMSDALNVASVISSMELNRSVSHAQRLLDMHLAQSGPSGNTVEGSLVNQESNSYELY